MLSERPLISFDYAIKYLLKDKGNYDIVEGFISALLATRGYQPVKIQSLLESESNKEDPLLKQSIADLVVCDHDNNQYIIEIERTCTPYMFHKALFNTSRTLIDNIPASQNYMNLKKVFHISLLYFDVPGMDAPIYHGNTLFHKINTEHPHLNQSEDS